VIKIVKILVTTINAPEILVFEDGTHDIKMKDGSYQVLVVDEKGVPTNVKHMKGYETRVYAQTRFCAFDLRFRTVVRGKRRFDLRS
jgi:hypothetical protein